MEKQCRTCLESKNAAEFGPDKKNADGLRATCRMCRNKEAATRRNYEPDLSAIPELRQFAVGDQQTATEAMIAHGSVADAAESLGWEPRRLRSHLCELARRAARAGWAPGQDMTKTVPDGYHVKGVSSYYNRDGELVGQWVKSSKDQEHRVEQLLDAVQSIAEPFKGLADPVVPPATPNADLLCVYPMGDPHLGMYAWAAETGASFDLEIAERNLCGAVDQLVALAPPAENALIINLGDFFHADNASNRTMRSSAALDVDTRWSKVLAVGIRAMRRCIDRALEKHAHVTVICEIGNHDDHSALMLGLCLSNYYEREPRVTIDTSPAKFHWYRFGANLIGVTHGDTVKAGQLPGIMAVDQAVAWGETKFRRWYCGHIHHDTLKEYPGCTVESFRTLAPKDAWHAAQGYRAGQDMKLDVIHRTSGPRIRHVVGIDMVTGEL